MALTPRTSATTDIPGEEYDERRERMRPMSRREKYGRGPVAAPVPTPTRTSMRSPETDPESLENMVRRIMIQSMPKTGFFGGPSYAGSGLPAGETLGQVIVNNGVSNVWTNSIGWPLDGMGVSVTNSAVNNSAIIETAMTRGGTLTLYTPGEYRINPLPQLPEGCELIIGPKVQLIEAQT
jgi:hypothetical protein